LLPVYGLTGVFIVVLITRRLMRTRRATRRLGANMAVVFSAVLGGTSCAPKPSDHPRRVTPDSERGVRRLTIEPTLHKLGRVLADTSDKVVHVKSKIKNTGNKVVNIKEIIVSCKCTEAHVDSPAISPGQETEFHAAIRIGRERTPQNSLITLKTDDLDQPLLRTNVQWRATALVDTVPLECDFGVVEPERDQTRTLRLVYYGTALAEGMAWTAKCSSDRVRAVVERADASRHAQGKQMTGDAEDAIEVASIRVTLAADKSEHDNRLPGNHFAERVALSPGWQLSEEQSAASLSIEIPVTWSEALPISIIPSRIFLGRTKQDSAAICSFRIRGREKGGVKVVEITSVDSRLLHGAIELSSQEFVTVDFPIRTPAQIGPWRSFVVVRLDDGIAPIRLPVSGINDQ